MWVKERELFVNKSISINDSIPDLSGGDYILEFVASYNNKTTTFRESFSVEKSKEEYTKPILLILSILGFLVIGIIIGYAFRKKLLILPAYKPYRIKRLINSAEDNVVLEKHRLKLSYKRHREAAIEFFGMLRKKVRRLLKIIIENLSGFFRRLKRKLKKLY